MSTTRKKNEALEKYRRPRHGEFDRHRPENPVGTLLHRRRRRNASRSLREGVECQSNRITHCGTYRPPPTNGAQAGATGLAIPGSFLR